MRSPVMKKMIPLALLLLFTCSAIFASATETACRQAKTTLALEECTRHEIATLESELESYLAAARQSLEGDEQSLAALSRAQQRWLDYRGEHCLAVRTLWVGGSIRGVMMNQCLLHQTRQRLWDIWDTYLTFMDSTPPLLPEPQR